MTVNLYSDKTSERLLKVLAAAGRLPDDEVRSLDSACNPYLAFAVVLAAGLRGIEENYQLTSPDIKEQLPTNLDEAIRAMESSDLVREALGQEVFDFVLRNKKAEWAEYSRQVSEYELERYLPVL